MLRKYIGFLVLTILSASTGCVGKNPLEGRTVMQSTIPTHPIQVGLLEKSRVANMNGAGYYIKDDGKVVNWGANEIAVPQLTDITHIPSSSGQRNTIFAALKSDGTIVTWGRLVSGDLPRATSIFIGGNRGAGISVDGKVFVWGEQAEQYSPPANLDHVVSIVVGEDYFLALKSDGTVVPWTKATAQIDKIPVVDKLPKNLNNIVQIAASGAHGIALRGDGTVITWGVLEPLFGNFTLPADLTKDYGAVAIAASPGYGAAVLADGSVKLWGGVNPDLYKKYADIADVVAGEDSIALLKKDGSFEFVWVSGSQCLECMTASTLSNIADISVDVRAVLHLDNSLFGYYDNLSKITGQKEAVSLTDAGGYIYLKNNNNQLRAFGDLIWGPVPSPTLANLENNKLFDAYGLSWIALGWDGGVTTDKPYSVLESTVVILNNIKLVAANNDFYLTVNKADEIQILIRGEGAQKEQLAAQALVTNKPKLKNITAVSLGAAHGLALTSDGRVSAWGDNTYGQISVPVGLDQVIAIKARAYDSVALKADGTVVTWGETKLTTPITNAVAIKARLPYGKGGLAIKKNGTIASWGTIYFSDDFYSLPFSK